MRWAIAVMLVSLTACGRSDQDVNNAVAAERRAAEQRLAELQNNQNAVNAARDCAVREQQLAADHRNAIESDKRTIMTTLGMVSNNDGTVQGSVGVTIQALDSGNWRWVTAAAGFDATAAVEGRVSFSVNPARLSSSVEVTSVNGMPSVHLRCVSGNCIQAIGRFTVQADGQSETRDVDEAVPNAVWALDTANRAQAVRDALSDLIRRTANPPTTGNCPAAGT